jgi:intein-encoded DNA endonuclease-like protein
MLTKIERAYIAGFLDGDGSIILQIVRRADYRLKFQIRASVCFYQRRTGVKVLEWIKERIGRGYIRHRGVMADYTVVGYAAVSCVLKLVEPYVVAKRLQVDAALKIIRQAQGIKGPSQLVAVARMVDRYVTLNYSKRRLVTACEVALTVGSLVSCSSKAR